MSRGYFPRHLHTPSDISNSFPIHTRVYRNAAWSTGTGDTSVLFPFDTISWDNVEGMFPGSGGYDVSNSTFYCPLIGLYEINARVLLAPISLATIAAESPQISPFIQLYAQLGSSVISFGDPITTTQMNTSGSVIVYDILSRLVDTVEVVTPGSLITLYLYSNYAGFPVEAGATQTFANFTYLGPN